MEDLGEPVGGRGKRLLDIAFALLAISGLSIFLVVVAVAIKIRSRGPVFFAHERVGYAGQPFHCLKFRTMVPDAAERLQAVLDASPESREEFRKHHKLHKDPRIIPGLGSFLRKTSLDEVPQFFNVLAGHMSVVGPRPVTSHELSIYGSAAKQYISARPGITGLWQVSGRSTTTFAERVEMDSTYLSNWSFWTDVRLIFRTIWAAGRGAC
ncbi:sugar transferase [Palleronia aestuarii]|nr:sugar transferase [Palleronia aestuarii]